ncbi:hypothetical protein AKO1_002362 [Acrasis kona]|uniref:Uncharacterized protein n=1 Tax=Acrasis kona TaxID=1008807 RepID=A0AAW2ZN80_9EUKA
MFGFILSIILFFFNLIFLFIKLTYMIAVVAGLVVFSIALNFFIQRRIRVLELQQQKSAKKEKVDEVQEIIAPVVVTEVDTLRNRSQPVATTTTYIEEPSPVVVQEVVPVLVTDVTPVTYVEEVVPVSIEKLPSPVIVQEVVEVAPIVVQEQLPSPVIVQEVKKEVHQPEVDVFEGIPEKIVTTFPLLPEQTTISTPPAIESTTVSEPVVASVQTLEQPDYSNLFPEYTGIVQEASISQPVEVATQQNFDALPVQQLLSDLDQSTAYVNQANVQY